MALQQTMKRAVGLMVRWSLELGTAYLILLWLRPADAIYGVLALLAWRVSHDADISTQKVRRYIGSGRWLALAITKLTALTISFGLAYVIASKFSPQTAFPAAATCAYVSAYIDARQIIACADTHRLQKLEAQSLVIGCIGMAVLSYVLLAGRQQALLAAMGFGLSLCVVWPTRRWVDGLATRPDEPLNMGPAA